MELTGKTALVTGAGAEGGIGYEVARLLAEQGADVVIAGRDAERGIAVAEKLTLALAAANNGGPGGTTTGVAHGENGAGGSVRFALADLTDVDQVQALADQAGEVDILVNNAAAIAVGPTTEQDVASYEESFAANVRAPFFLTKALAPKMIARGGGSIVNVSTMVAQIGMPGMSVYGATKAALESLTRTWAAEFAPAGIRVNAVAPGPTRSDKVVSLMGDGVEELGRTTPLQRTASPTEIAELIVFLAGEKASYVTGATVAADGGRTAV